MSIFVDESTRVVVQGLTGSQGRFHGLRNRDYGTQVVAGVTPGKGGTDVEGIPVFDTVAEAVDATGADASFVVVPPKGAPGAIVDAAAAGIAFIVCITEGIPAQDEALVYNILKRRYPRCRLLGPNCPGVISPGKCNIGITSGDIALPGGPVGIVSRSGTLTYQALHELSQQKVGQTTCVGIGGDPVPGTSFIDCLAAFEQDADTRAVMLIGEIGGSAEEEAAAFIKEHMSKPVVCYIAGVTAPPGRKMGHAGAIISGSAGTAQAKMEALAGAGAGSILDAILGEDVPVSLVLADRPCPALQVGADAGVETALVDRAEFGGFGPEFDREAFTQRVTDVLDSHRIDLVAMAGFGTVLTRPIHDAFGGRIINTHPALLPAFPGWHAVEDALAAGVEVTGCTVHVATLDTDAGPVLAQEQVPVLPDDTVATLHERIKEVERRLYPATIRSFIAQLEAQGARR
jgi:succinyl-CoA synthetase alpha subunit